MTTYWGFNHTTDPDDGGAPNADSGVMLGTVFTITASGCSIKKIGFWKPSTDPTTTRVLALFLDDGATSGQAYINSWSTTSEPTGTSQWIEYTLPSPEAVSANLYYVIAVGYPNGEYPARGSYFDETIPTQPGSSGITHGPLTIPNAADAVTNTDTGIANGRYTYYLDGLGATIPDHAFNKTCYWIDVQIDDGTGGGSSVKAQTGLHAVDSGSTGSRQMASGLHPIRNGVMCDSHNDLLLFDHKSGDWKKRAA